jgi:hypothetical protein
MMYIRTMKRIAISLLMSIFMIVPAVSGSMTLQNLIGHWQGPNYIFTMNGSYKATVVIMANQYESFVFNGVYTLEKDSVLRININEMKSCAPGEIYSKRGFTKTASSRFVFAAEIKTDKTKTLLLKPKEIIIDGNNSDGYFEPLLTLMKK